MVFRGLKFSKLAFGLIVSLSGILVPRDNSEVVYAELGSSITLPCIFSNELLLNSSTWEKVSKASNLPAVLPLFLNISSNPGVSRCSSMQRDRSAYIERVQDGDEGTYRCSGQVKRDNGKRMKVERDIQLVTAQGECQTPLLQIHTSMLFASLPRSPVIYFNFNQKVLSSLKQL